MRIFNLLGRKVGVVEKQVRNNHFIGLIMERAKKNRRDFETTAVFVVVIMELNFMRSIFSSFVLLAKPKIPPIQLTNFHWWSGGPCSGSNQQNLNWIAIQMMTGKNSVTIKQQHGRLEASIVLYCLCLCTSNASNSNCFFEARCLSCHYVWITSRFAGAIKHDFWPPKPICCKLNLVSHFELWTFN